MIQVTRFNQEKYYLNPLIIETVEATPDTIITLVTGKKLLVKESPDVVVQKMKDFYETIHFGSLPTRIYSQSSMEGDLD